MPLLVSATAYRLGPSQVKGAARLEPGGPWL